MAEVVSAQPTENTGVGIRKSASSAEHLEDVKTGDKFRDIETVALVVTEPKADFKLTPIILDEVRDNEVLIEMKYSGICHTDIVLQQGLLPMVDFPAIFGHEGAGYVRAIGFGVKANYQVGDAVLLSFTTCGECKACKTHQLDDFTVCCAWSACHQALLCLNESARALQRCQGSGARNARRSGTLVRSDAKR